MLVTGAGHPVIKVGAIVKKIHGVFRNIGMRVLPLFYGILLAHILAMFCLSVEAGAFLVIDVGRRINPDLTIASAGCRGRDCNRTLGAGYRRSSRSRRRLSGSTVPVRLFRRRRR
jgi:hypothetical protein